MKAGANKFAICLFLLLFCGFYCPLQSFGTSMNQSRAVVDDEKTVTLSITQRTLVYILSEIKKQTGLAYGFKNSNHANREEYFSINVKRVSVDSALNVLLKDSKYSYQIVGDLILITDRVSKQIVKENLMKVSGRVTDEKGNPIPGATILIHGTKTGIVSDENGRYELDVQPEDVLVISFIGYKTEVKPIQGKAVLNVVLQPQSQDLEEVAVVAFGTQKKESVVGSITTVRPMDLKTSSSDLTAGFVGRIPGMIGWKIGGLPVALTEDEMNTEFYIRGIASFNKNANTDPLILLDGVEISKLDLSRIPVEDIETFSVMKDASATAMYGARGANGVILVTTKKGEAGSVYTTARYEMVVTSPTRVIDVVDPIDYMRYYNQALIGRSTSATPKYSVETINRTASGKYPSWVYPKNEWYDILFKDFAVNHHAGVTIRGGSDIVQYYASVTYNYDQGMLKTDRLNEFDVNIRNHQIGYRTNLNIDLKAGIKLLINSSATLDRYHGPNVETTTAYSYAFNASPVDFAPTYPADDTYNWPHIRFGTSTAGSYSYYNPSGAINPYALIQAGYVERTRYSTVNKAEYIQNLSPLLKGLELRLSASLVQSGNYDQGFTTIPYYYYLSSYNQETGVHQLAPDPNENNMESKRTLDVGSTASSTDTRITYEGRLYHTAVWKDHQTSVTLVGQLYERTFNPIADVLNGQPQRNLNYSARVSYGYKDRYFIEASGAYNGSERFAEHNRMGFFPAVGGAWVVSSEEWMRPLSKIIPFFKLRLSYGKVGNDGIVSTPRYVYIPTIGDINSVGGVAATQIPQDLIPNPQKAYFRKAVIAYPNESIQWEVAETTNFGIELGFFDGLFEIQADIYEQIRHNIISSRMVLPAHMGIEMPPLDNIGSTCSRGVDLAAKVQKAFTNDIYMILNGTFTYNKTVYKEIEEAMNKPEWQLKPGQEISQEMGYIAEGLFRDWAEINNAPRQDGDVMPGDIRYRDIDGDNSITVSDATFIGYPTTPRFVYGINGFFNFKHWELNFAFQGAGKRSFFMNPVALSPFVGDHAMLQAIADDHWSDDNMARKPFWPRLSTYSITQHNPYEDWNNEENAEIRKSTYFMRECWFLRCTSISLAYSLPRKWLDRLKMQDVKFTLSTNNPFMISDFDVWDVELGENAFNYPIQKTYSLGLSVNF